jgi:demethylmenaquinone methyltransferase/2-methoxy-6-polyprenyl-1,4-benzoquinol methylase
MLHAKALEKSPDADGSGAMFDRIAPRYDLLNHLMSFGLHHLWRRRLVRALGLKRRARVLDVATGTADVALAICARHHDAEVVGLDPSHAMLDVGVKKVAGSEARGRVQLVPGDAQALPYATASFDAACISFGIRNVPDRQQGLREMARVVKPGGRVAVLELGEPRDGWLGPLVRWHVHSLVPRLGAWLSGADEYRYLQASIAAFPSPPVFVEMMRQAGMTRVTHDRLSFGAVHLYVGEVAPRGTV